jgi:hypothetical protein
METLFSMWPVPRCYKHDSLKQRVTCWLELSVDKSSVQAAVTKAPERGKLRHLPR